VAFFNSNASVRRSGKYHGFIRRPNEKGGFDLPVIARLVISASFVLVIQLDTWDQEIITDILIGKEVNHQSQLYVCVLYCYT
jgi:hypothetical protein